MSGRRAQIARHLGTFEGFGTDSHSIRTVFIDAMVTGSGFPRWIMSGIIPWMSPTVPLIAIETITPTPTPTLVPVNVSLTITPAPCTPPENHVTP